MDNQFLTPNHQLYLILAALLAIPLFAGLTVWLTRGYIDKKLGPAVPLWEVALADLQAKLTHPHPFAKEMDELMKTVSPKGEVDWAAYDRLKKKMLERTLSDDPNLREGEADAALAYLLVWKLARNESQSGIPLTGIRMVGTQAVADQSLHDKIEEELGV